MHSSSASEAEQNSQCSHPRLERVEPSIENAYKCDKCSGIFKVVIDSLAQKENSNLQKDFEFVEMLGSGGFGAVGKFRKKLDGKLYAIKKIDLGHQVTNDSQLDERIKREINHLSELSSHENIVRYYNCWIEDFDSLPQR